MTYKLFLDDLRSPINQSWVVCRSVAAAKEYVSAYGLPLAMSLDHDLGGEDAPVFLHWLIQLALDDPNALVACQEIIFSVHSANPVGVQNLNGLWDCFLRSTIH